MATFLRVFNWKRICLITLFVLAVLIILNFYGIYSNKFYFLKPDNYIIPALAIIHSLYLYVIWFKITEDELPDPKMRNLEYVVYAILAVYLFKVYDSAIVLGSYSDYEDYILPSSFKPIGIITLALYCLMPFLTVLSFCYRRKLIGEYNFENYDNNLNAWQE